MAHKRPRMELPSASPPISLLQLPDSAILGVLRCLDASSLVALDHTARYFTRKDPVSHMPLTEHIARELVVADCGGDADAAARFR